MKIPRIYLDTSVFGGCFDEEFAQDSLRLMEEIKAGKFRLVMSESILSELGGAPEQVREAGYLSVNIRMGYGTMGIYSPKEMVTYEDQGV